MRRPEAALQRAVAKFLTMALPVNAWFTAINPNPSKGKIAGAISKAMGAKAGVPEILIVHQGRVHWVELKATKRTVSMAQRETAIDLAFAGCADLLVCRSIGEVAMALAEWGIPCKARVAA